MTEPCKECDGRGEYLDAPSNVLDGRAYMTPCPDCQGTGVVDTTEDEDVGDTD